jgi:hypothetical protein
VKLSYQRAIIALAIIGVLVFLALFWRDVVFLADVIAYAVWYRLS